VRHVGQIVNLSYAQGTVTDNQEKKQKLFIARLIFSWDKRHIKQGTVQDKKTSSLFRGICDA
jgi:hypothetical protein